MNGNSIQTNFNQKTMVFLSIDPVRDGYTPDHGCPVKVE